MRARTSRTFGTSSASVAAAATNGFMQTWNLSSGRPDRAAPARTAGSITFSM
ncbi:hypothetical protein D3C86_2259440 [compost metagenome]